jgi:hypothetical protein
VLKSEEKYSLLTVELFVVNSNSYPQQLHTPILLEFLLYLNSNLLLTYVKHLEHLRISSLTWTWGICFSPGWSSAKGWQ